MEHVNDWCFVTFIKLVHGRMIYNVSAHTQLTIGIIHFVASLYYLLEAFISFRCFLDCTEICSF